LALPHEISRVKAAAVDVGPAGGGRWVASCVDCGESYMANDAEAGWTWLLDHPCVEDVQLPSQREPADDTAAVED